MIHPWTPVEFLWRCSKHGIRESLTFRLPDGLTPFPVERPCPYMDSSGNLCGKRVIPEIRFTDAG